MQSFWKLVKAGLVLTTLAVAVPMTAGRVADYPFGQRTNKIGRRLLLYRLGFIVGRTRVGMEVQQAAGLGA